MQPYKLQRRQVLKGLGLLPLSSAFGASTLFAQTPASGIVLQKLHCFEIRVSDVERTVNFYQDLFGMPVISDYGERICLGVGESPQFMAVRALQAGESPAITQLGYSVADFQTDALQEKLAQTGITAIDEAPPLSEPGLNSAMHSWVRMRDQAQELYFADAQGLIVQLCPEGYCGGSGALGDVCENPQTAAPGMFNLSEISHFTVFVNDGAAANAFYQDAFGLEVQAYQGPGSQVTGIGDGYQFVMYAGPFPGNENKSVPANLHHGCFNMHGFDVEEILTKLTDYGLQDRGDAQTGPLMHYISRRMPERGGAEGGTPELYFTDPDGILMQLQDISYCGGGGYLGNECIRG